MVRSQIGDSIKREFNLTFLELFSENVLSEDRGIKGPRSQKIDVFRM